MSEDMISASAIRHRYGDREALCGVDLEVPAGCIYGLLGPNGSGKTTLFRLLSTLMPLQSGRMRVAGADVATEPMAVRGRIGIVFQAPSLDKKLTVDENIACQAALYGLSGRALRERRDEVLRLMRLEDRRGEYCEKLSGGLKRRVELAKGMLHEPRVLLLDEPSTGLDPAARLDLWDALRAMASRGMTILLTTHLLEEAEKADQIAILAAGQVITRGRPEVLRADLGQGLVTVTSDEPASAQQQLEKALQVSVQRVQQQLRIHSDRPAELVPQIAECLGPRALTITVGRPSLEDVFIAKTGHRFWAAESNTDAAESGHAVESGQGSADRNRLAAGTSTGASESA